MQRRRAPILVGVAIIALAADMIVGIPWFISWPLLSIGLFLLAWGVAPGAVMRGVAALPSGTRLTVALNEFDRWLAGATGAQESLDRLSYKMDDGLEILNRRVNSADEFRDWMADEDAWVSDIFSEIETHFSRAQAVTFRTVGSVVAADIPPSYRPEHNNRKLLLNKRIDNLRNFLDAESGKL